MSQPTTQKYAWPEGALEVSYPRPDVVLFMVEGKLSSGAEQHVIDCADEALRASETIHAFHDWDKMTGYTPDARRKLTEYVSLHEKDICGHILFSSQLVAMGVSVANLVLKNRLEVYSDRAKFEAAMQQVLERS